ncbi:hypothetical protein LCGC14_1987100 [marine sediment metagenome]|uniref:Uncharacterized protein n=1 Tax=marine sediment metagenome TaxID=412755 RepID=A0A0F9HKH9_9ZZZZ
MDSWNKIQPREQAPVSKVPCDVIGRVGTNVDLTIRHDQAHARVKTASAECGKAAGQSRSLTGHAFETTVPIIFSDPRNLSPTEGALPVEHHHGLSGSFGHMRHQPLALSSSSKAYALPAYEAAQRAASREVVPSFGPDE